MDLIFIRGLAVTTIVGHYPRERESAQTIEFNIDLGIPGSTVYASDKLVDTINYAAVAEYVKHVQAAFSPETPFEVSAKTQWRRAIPYDDGNGGVQWTDINGEAAVKARSVEDVLRFKSETNFPPQTLALLEANPHLYYDERAGEVKAVQAQVRSIEE